MPGLPGVVLTRQGPLGAFTTKLREAMAETGMVLDGSGGWGSHVVGGSGE